MTPPISPARGGVWSWLPWLAVSLVGLVAYHNCFTGAFVLDDLRGIAQNPAIRHVWPRTDIWRSTTRPLTEFTFAVNYAAAGLDRGVWHTVNLSIHLVTASLWFWLVRDALIRRNWAAQTGWSPDWTAAIAAGLWVAHPLTTEAVTYTVQRSESLAACGMLATLALWNCAGRAKTNAVLWLALSLGMAFLSAASKPTAIVLPVLLFIYDRSLLADSWSDMFRRRGYALLLIWLPTLWIIWDAFGAGLLTPPASTATAAASTAGVGAAGLTSWEYLRSQSGILLYYLWLVVSGTSQSLDYGWLVADRVDVILGTTFVVAGVLIGCLLVWRWAPAISCLGLSMFVLLAPTSSVIPLRDLAVEHRMYLPSACVLTLLVLGAMATGVRVQRCAGFLGRWGIGVALGLCLLLGIGRTITRNADYHDEVRLWSRAVAATPDHPRAHMFLAEAWLRRNQTTDAIEILERAVELYAQQRRKPVPPPIERANAFSLLGSAYESAGRHTQAEVALRQAVELAPRAAFLSNLGAVLQRRGDLTEAEEIYRRALDADGAYSMARVNLGRLLLQKQQTAAAVEILEPVRSDVPPSTAALLTLARAYEQVDRLDDADAIYRRLVDEQAADADTYMAWGKLHRRRGQYVAALKCFVEAARLEPQAPWPPALQAEMLARLGESDAADQLAVRLLKQLPPDSVIAEQLRALRLSLRPNAER